mgnify:FL=1
MVNWIGYTKALHLIFMVSWFAGLFYMVRLFVYHAESEKNHGELAFVFQKQYLLMQSRLWYIISWPSLLLTLLFGSITLFSKQYSYLLHEPYMHVKLGFVFLLVIYHITCHKIHLDQKKGVSLYTGIQMRVWNEVATLFLVIITFVIVLRDQLDGFYGTIGFILFAISLFLGIRLYKRLRKE